LAKSLGTRLRSCTASGPHARSQRWLKYGPPVQPYDSFALDLLHHSSDELILDNGAGNGRFAASLASMGSRVVALDIDLKLLKAARQNTRTRGNVSVIRADMTNLPFVRESFDKVICVHNLWYVGDYEKAVHEMRRVLSRCGMCVVDHLNLLDPRAFAHVAFYVSAIRALAGRGPMDIGRTLWSLMRPFRGTRAEIYSVMAYEPLHIVKDVRNLARRFVITFGK